VLYREAIYPKNLYLTREPMKHEEYRREVIDKQIALMHQRGIWKKSSYD
jgi:beta-ureidopropionase